MATINFTIDTNELLPLLKQDCDGAFKQLFQEALNTIMKSESETQLGAAPYERSDKRSDSRNGFRERKLTTRLSGHLDPERSTSSQRALQDTDIQQLLTQRGGFDSHHG